MRDRNKLAVYEITCVPEEVTDYAKKKSNCLGRGLKGIQMIRILS